MTGRTHSLKVCPLQPQVPAFRGLNRFDMMYINCKLCAAFQLRLALIVNVLQLLFAGHAPRLTSVERCVLRIPLAVVSLISFPAEALLPVFLQRMPVLFDYRGADLAVSQPLRYEPLAPRTDFKKCHGKHPGNKNGLKPTGLSLCFLVW